MSKLPMLLSTQGSGRMRRMRALSVVTLAAASLILAGCSGGPAPGPDTTAAPTPGSGTDPVKAELNALYEAAKASGNTSAYVAGPPGAIDDRIVGVFKKAYPEIDVKLDFAFGAPLQQKMEGEFATGNAETDVVFGASDIKIFADKGYLEEYRPASQKGLDDEFIESVWANPMMPLYGPVYNTGQLKAADAPVTYADMVNPNYAGKIGTGNPTIASSSSYAIGIPLTKGIIDKKWVTAFAALSPRVFPNQTAAVQDTVNGTTPILWNTSYTNYLAAKADGAQLEFVPLKEGVFGNPLPFALVKGGPNADAAKLFLAWLYTPDAQTALAEFGIQGTMPDSPRPKGLGNSPYIYVPNSELLSLVNDPAGFLTTIKTAFGK